MKSSLAARWIALAVGAVAPLSAFGNDWSQWRGPEQSGISRETDLPEKFDPFSGENVAWKNEKVTGMSSPIVMNGQVVHVDARRRGDRTARGRTRRSWLGPQTQEALVCVDINDRQDAVGVPGEHVADRRAVPPPGVGERRRRSEDGSRLRVRRAGAPGLPGRGDGQAGLVSPDAGGVRADLDVRRADGVADDRRRPTAHHRRGVRAGATTRRGSTGASRSTRRRASCGGRATRAGGRSMRRTGRRSSRWSTGSGWSCFCAGDGGGVRVQGADGARRCSGTCCRSAGRTRRR